MEWNFDTRQFSWIIETVKWNLDKDFDNLELKEKEFATGFHLIVFQY